MCVAFAAFIAASLMEVIPIAWLGAVPISIFLLSRIPQIVANHQSKFTGQLSVVTLALNLVGSTVRLLTTYVELAGNVSVMAQYSLSVVLNAILLLQVCLYWNNTAKRGADRSGKSQSGSGKENGKGSTKAATKKPKSK